jgi:TetR/AcrR family transcriptional repressor of nem operon
MGHSQADKARTHDRIVAAASKEFREKGLNGIGVADIMTLAGSSAGGFYKHFASRGALVAEAVEAAFGAFDARIHAGAVAGRPVTFDHLLDEYLDVQHRDNPGDGCPFATLSSDLARSGEVTRTIATTQLEHAIELLASLMGCDDASVARTEAILAYTAMIGAVSLARLANDDALSRDILERTRAALTRTGRPPE